jgi:hypothetical protein
LEVRKKEGRRIKLRATLPGGGASLFLSPSSSSCFFNNKHNDDDDAFRISARKITVEAEI